MKSRLFVGLLLVIVGFLILFSDVALSFFAFFKYYTLVFSVLLLAVILSFIGIWLIAPLGIWGD
jgi:hypothetical protein